MSHPSHFDSPFQSPFGSPFGSPFDRGDSSPFNPTDIPSLIQWLDSTMNITIASGGVSGWGDRSGHHHGVNQDVSNARPTFQPTGMNGGPSLSFDGSNDAMVLDGSGPSDQPKLTGSFTSYVVCNVTAVASQRTLFSKTDSYHWRVDTADKSSISVTSLGETQLDVSEDAITEGTDVILSLKYNLGGVVELRQNGVALGTFPTNTLTDIASSEETYILGGATDEENPTQLFHGKMSNVLLFNEPLSISDENKVGNYLADLAGVTWTDILTPNDVSGLVMWLNAFENITLNVTNVSGWGDESGNGNNASQVSPVNQPAFNSTGINGQPSLTFDGVDEYMSALDSASLGITGSFTAFAVHQITDEATYRHHFSKNHDNGYRFRVNPSEQLETVCNDGNGVQVDISNAITVGSPHIVVVQLQVGGPGTIQFRQDGVDSGSTANTLTSIQNINEPMGIGATQTGGLPSEFFNGELGQILIFNTVLTNADMNTVMEYLANLYGLSWTPIV